MWLKLKGASAAYETVTGAIVNFTTQRAAPLKSLLVSMSPQQDLHGYDSPWPAGGGVNKLPKCVAGTYTSGGCTVVVADDGTMTLSGTSGDTSTNISIPLVEAVYTPTEDFYLHFLNSDVMGSVSMAVEDSSSQGQTPIYGTLSPANRISKITGTDRGVYVNRIRFWIAANKTLSGTVHPMFCLDNTVRAYSPYENLCPISGYEGVTAWDDPYYGGLIEWNQLVQNTTADYSNKWGAFAGTLSFDGDIAIVVPNGAHSSTLHYGLGYDGSSTGLVEDHIYFCSGKVKSTQANRYRLRFSNITHYSPSVAAGTWTTAEMIGNATSNLQVLTFYAENDTVYSAEDTISFKDMILCDLTEMFGAGNEPATVAEFRELFPLDYYAYNAGTETTAGAVNGDPGWKIAVAFPDGETYYSGWVDPTTGDGEITGVKYVVDETATGILVANRVASVGGVYFWRNTSTMTSLTAAQLPTAKQVERYSHGTIEDPRGNEGNYAWVYKSSDTLSTLRFGFADSSIATVDDLKAFVAEYGNLEIYYPIETPIPFQLTPQEVLALVGENNCWSNADTVTVEYRSN